MRPPWQNADSGLRNWSTTGFEKVEDEEASRDFKEIRIAALKHSAVHERFTALGTKVIHRVTVT